MPCKITTFSANCRKTRLDSYLIKKLKQINKFYPPLFDFKLIPSTFALLDGLNRLSD